MEGFMRFSNPFTREMFWLWVKHQSYCYLVFAAAIAAIYVLETYVILNTAVDVESLGYWLAESVLWPLKVVAITGVLTGVFGVPLAIMVAHIDPNEDKGQR